VDEVFGVLSSEYFFALSSLSTPSSSFIICSTLFSHYVSTSPFPRRSPSICFSLFIRPLQMSSPRPSSPFPPSCPPNKRLSFPLQLSIFSEFFCRLQIVTKVTRCSLKRRSRRLCRAAAFVRNHLSAIRS
jgi:hypothetical protein